MPRHHLVAGGWLPVLQLRSRVHSVGIQCVGVLLMDLHGLDFADRGAAAAEVGRSDLVLVPVGLLERRMRRSILGLRGRTSCGLSVSGGVGGLGLRLMEVEHLLAVDVDDLVVEVVMRSVWWLKTGLLASSFVMAEAVALHYLLRRVLSMLLGIRGGETCDLERPTASAVLLDGRPFSAPVLHDVLHLHLIYLALYCFG